MTSSKDFLIVGGYGVVGRRIAAQLATAHPGCVVVAGRNPVEAIGMRTRHIDVDEPSSIESALEGVAAVVACVRQREPHLLRAVAHRGIAYTSIAPPWMEWAALAPLDEEARRSGARVVLAAGIEPGISSMLARIGADRVGRVDAIETALLLSIGDAYGADSMSFMLDELRESYAVLVDGRVESAHAFGRPALVAFPAPIAVRRAYTMPFRDQLHYPRTLGARTSIARLALDPPWVGRLVAALLNLGARSWIGRSGARDAMHWIVNRLQQRSAGHDRFALVVEVRGDRGVARSTLVGHAQADATMLGAVAIAEALYASEVREPGVWLAEQVIAPEPFLARLAAGGLVPATEVFVGPHPRDDLAASP